MSKSVLSWKWLVLLYTPSSWWVWFHIEKVTGTKKDRLARRFCKSQKIALLFSCTSSQHPSSILDLTLGAVRFYWIYSLQTHDHYFQASLAVLLFCFPRMPSRFVLVVLLQPSVFSSFYYDVQIHIQSFTHISCTICCVPVWKIAILNWQWFTRYISILFSCEWNQKMTCWMHNQVRKLGSTQIWHTSQIYGYRFDSHSIIRLSGKAMNFAGNKDPSYLERNSLFGRRTSQARYIKTIKNLKLKESTIYTSM